MVRFLFHTFNHNEMGIRSLEDVIGIMIKQMRALGHAAEYAPTKKDQFLAPGAGINVVIEGFTEWSVRCLTEARTAGARFVILATEEPTPKGFNHGTQPEMVKRQEIFPSVAKLADGIIHLVPGDHITKWFSQFAPSAPAELGYAPDLVRKDKIEPTWDFGFYGSLSERRITILKKVAKKTGGRIKIVGDFKTQLDRDLAMQQTKVILQVRKFEEMGLVSSSRLSTSLCLGRPVIAEPHLLSKPWDEVVPFAKDMEQFYNLAIMTRAMWRTYHGSQFAKFKERFSPEICIGRALNAIGVASP